MSDALIALNEDEGKHLHFTTVEASRKEGGSDVDGKTPPAGSQRVLRRLPPRREEIGARADTWRTEARGWHLQLASSRRRKQSRHSFLSPGFIQQVRLKWPCAEGRGTPGFNKQTIHTSHLVHKLDKLNKKSHQNPFIVLGF